MIHLVPEIIYKGIKSRTNCFPLSIKFISIMPEKGVQHLWVTLRRQLQAPPGHGGSLRRGRDTSPPEHALHSHSIFILAQIL